jgi:hypothetical protein
MHSHLLGFDIRLTGESLVDHMWDADYRREYLLRSDICWPMSVDRAVWPSAFQGEYLYRVNGVKKRVLSVLTATPPSELRTDLDLWRDWRTMQAWFAEHRTAGFGDGVRIGVSVLLGEGDQPTGPLSPGLLETISPLPSGANTLGFDVADANLLSGLSNCGYGADEMEQRRAEWRHRIGDRGLIDGLADAVSFCSATNERVAGHRPFFVFAIHGLT